MTAVDYLAVLPSIWPEWTEECLASCGFDRDRVIVVDNTEKNRGVAASWNIGALQAVNERRDWVILMSAGVRFREPRGTDFLAALAEHPDAYCVEAADGIGWHLLAIHRRALEAAGLFDENFWPAYWEDIDWSYRFAVAASSPPYQDLVVEPFWVKVQVDAWVAGVAHGTKLAGVQIPANRLIGYYVRKWGGLSGLERYRHPFNDPDKAVWWCPDTEEDR